MAVEKILLQFEADIKDLKSELNQVKGKLSDTEKEGKKVGSSLTKSFTNVGKAIGAAFSVQVLIQFTKKAVELYDIQAKAEASLLQALKGREDVQRRLMAQASELQKITLFGDEETIKAQAMLAKFGMTETQIKRLIPLIQDYATISGQDLVSAADMVARSVGTSTNALTRYGIEITGAVGSSERLESAISNLNAQVGGQAVAAAQAGSGAIEQFNMAWGDFAELVGEEVLPAIIAITGELKIFLEQLIELKSAGDDGFLKRLFTEGVIGAIGFARDMGKARERLENATDYEGIFNKAQDDFAKFVKNNKEKYSTLVDAATAYADDLNAELRRVNRQWADGQISDDDAFKIRKRISIVQEAIDAYVKEMDNGVRITNKFNTKLDDSFKVNKKELASFILELRDLNGLFAEAIVLNGLSVESLSKVFTNYENNLQRIKGTTATFVDTTQEAADWTQAWFDISKSVFSGIGDLSDQQTEKYINNLQTQLDAGAITQEQFEKQRAEALRKQAKQDKSYSIFRIILDTANGIVNFLKANPPNPAGAIAAGITGAIQTGVVINQPLPAFAKGVVDLKGEGTETSDSIFARLSKGESVITAKGTKQDKKLFEAANKLMLEDYIHANYVLPALKDKQNSDKAMFDDYRLYLSLQNIKSNDSRNTEKIVQAIVRQKNNRHRYWA